jgi:very-short-patch-repair endonuclease
MKRHLPQYSKSLVPIARLLRKQMTDAERKLWALLRRNQLGVRFRCQVPFGPYVVDFYCVKAKLVIELDGSQHYTDLGRQKDAERDNYLRGIGQDVARYSDIELLQNEDGVMQDIFEQVKARVGGLKDPLSRFLGFRSCRHKHNTNKAACRTAAQAGFWEAE